MIGKIDCIKEVEKKIGYNFLDKELLKQAFTRKSYAIENSSASNEILEFIGDRVLDYFVTKIIVEKYAFDSKNAKSEGDFTDIKKRLVNKKMLAHRIDVLKINNCLLMSKGDILKHIQNEPSVKEDLFESILGAIAIDSKWNSLILEKCVKVMLDIDNYLENGFDDYKDYIALIQKWNQINNGDIPKYIYEENEMGTFTAKICLNTKRGYLTYQDFGRSKSESRFNVSRKAYLDLEKNKEILDKNQMLFREIDLENSVNKLQELFQKKIISEPKYIELEIVDSNGDLKWEVSSKIDSHNIEIKVQSTSKKIAKKLAALEVLKDLMKKL